jgi:hypothetical protein
MNCRSIMWLKFVNFVKETHTCSYSVCEDTWKVCFEISLSEGWREVENLKFSPFLIGEWPCGFTRFHPRPQTELSGKPPPSISVPLAKHPPYPQNRKMVRPYCRFVLPVKERNILLFPDHSKDNMAVRILLVLAILCNPTNSHMQCCFLEQNVI